MRKVRVGVYQSQFPYSSKCAYHNYPIDKPYSCAKDPSLISDILAEVAKGTDIYYEFVHSDDYGSQDANGTWRGTVGLLKNGSVDIAPDFWIRPERMNLDILFSTAYFKVERCFVTAAESSSLGDLNVFVFQPSFLIILFSFVVLIGILFTYIIRFTTTLNVWQAFEIFVFRLSSQQLLHVRKYAFLFPGFLLVQLIYYGEFRGQAARKLNVPVVVKAHDFRKELVDGRMRMLIRTAIPIGLEEILFGRVGINASNEPILIEDVEIIAEKLCSHPNYYIYYGDPQPLYGLQLPCQIKIFDFDENAAILSAISYRSYVTFGFRKNLDQYLIDRINFILLTLFNHDNVLKFWFRRYGLNLDLLKATVDWQISHIVLQQIVECFVLYVCGMLAAVLIFVVERIRMASKRKKEAKKRYNTRSTVISNSFELPELQFMPVFSSTDC